MNKAVNGVSVTFAVTLGGGSISGATQTTNSSGIATVGSWTLGTNAGINSLSATAAGLAGAPLTITATAILTNPDYTVTAMSAPATGIVGNTIAVAATILDQGGAGGPFRLGFYFSTDPTITTADVYSGWACSFDSAIPANTTIDCTGSIGVPSTLPPGTYFVGAIADDEAEVSEANESNNARAAAAPTQLSPAVRPDLVVDAMTAPANGAIGGNVNLTATVRNSGSAATGAFRLGIYISTDAAITTADLLFANCTYSAGLAVNTASDCSGPVTVPATLASGTYFIGAIADDLGQVIEVNETNNSRASGAITLTATSKPDLIMETMTAPGTGTINGTISIAARVHNLGSQAGPFRVGFYYSTDANITTADVFSGSVCEYAAGLVANELDDCSGVITVPGTLPPGTYFVGAIADDQGQVPETLETNNARAAATTTVISQSGATLDLLIDGMYVTQSAQTYTGTVPLVANRGALLRVFVRATQANSSAPTVRARFFQNGTLVDTRIINAPTASVPMTISQTPLTASWNTDISALMQPGLSVLVDVDPTNAIAESNESDNAFPLSGTPKALDVRVVNTYNVTLVPVVQTPNGLRGDVTEANKATYMDFATRVYPLSTTSAIVHAPYNYSSVLANNYDVTWTNLLNEMTALRATEGSARRYYGVLKPAYTFGGTGLGTIDGNAAIGIDWSTPVTGSNTTLRSMTAAHEWGHNFGRLHVNCGDPAGPDPNYPYTPNSIGVFGYDITRGVLLPPTPFADLMTYCTPLWISDYTYAAVLSYRATHPSSVIGAASQPGLLIWGHVGPEGVVLEPAFEVDAPPLLPERAGPYSVRATDALGRELFSLSFDGDAIDHSPGVRQFAFVVPLPAASTKPATLRLAGNGRESLQRSPSPALMSDSLPGGAGDVRLRSGTGSKATLEWNSARYPMVLVRDPLTREVLSFARGGRLDLNVPGRSLELLLSDGAGSVRLLVSKSP